MGAHHDGTRAQSVYGLKEKVSATDTRKERPLERGSRPRGVEEAGSLMEECLLAPHCGMRHRATACEKFRELSLQHRQSVIAEKELCASCLRHSDLDESKRGTASGRRPRPTGWAAAWSGPANHLAGRGSCRRRWRQRQAGQLMPVELTSGSGQAGLAEGGVRGESSYAVQCIEADDGYCASSGRGEGAALEDGA
jgi:hypothetical protein